jgi:hypothetical protein
LNHVFPNNLAIDFGNLGAARPAYNTKNKPNTELIIRVGLKLFATSLNQFIIGFVASGLKSGRVLVELITIYNT